MENNTALAIANAHLATVDQQSGEIVETPLPSYDGIARERFTPEQQAKLKAPVDVSLVKKRLDGHYYVDGIHYRNVLDEAFGVGAWAILPIREWTERTTMHTKNGEKPVAKVYLQGQLWIEGRFVSQSIGEDVYYLDNQSDSYATAWEKAKSNLLMRCCKELGIFRDLWNKDWLKAHEREFGRPPQPATGQTQNGHAPAQQQVQGNGHTNGVPHHQTTNGAAPFQQGYVMPLSKERLSELANHYAINVEKKDREYTDRQQVKRRGREFHVSGISEPLSVCIPGYILDTCTRTKDQPYDSRLGLWIRAGVLSFGTVEGLGTFFSKLDEHQRTVVDRKPKYADAPLMTSEPDMLPQYANDDLPF